MVSKASTSLAPGFRFHPTDEELVRYYLRRKICGKPFRFDAISEIDIYKAEPWDLPGMSKLKTRDLEWYFFSVLDKKYGNGCRTNRATDTGYWKTTGKDRPVYHKSNVVGMKKTLVYHSGRAPKGQRTNWVMHEYRLIDEELEKSGIVQKDAFVLCRIFQKSGSGPKNGEQYGAPFVEEEWEDDDLEMLPKEEAAEEVEVGVDAYLDGNDLEQILAAEIPTDNVPLPLNYYPGENTIFIDEATESIGDSQKLSVGSGQNDYGDNQSDDQKPFYLPVQYDMHQKPVKHEYIGESSKSVNLQDIDYLLDEPYIDATDNLPFGDGAFLETNDLSNPIDADAAGFDMLEEYLTFFDANGDIAVDPLTMEGGLDLGSGELNHAEKDVKEGIQPVMSSKQLEYYDDDATSSKESSSKFESGYQHPFMKQASRMLGSIPAPPAFASEFPSKDVALHLNSGSSSSSVHVTAAMIQIRNMSMDRRGPDWSLGKHGQYNVTLSFGLSRGEDNSTTLESAVAILPGKTISLAPSGWFYFIFFWVVLLSVSFKIGTLICAQ